MKLFGRELTIEQIISFCKMNSLDRRCKQECLLSNAVDDLVAEIERLQNLNDSEWTSVSDKLPEITRDDCSEDVLIAVKYATDFPHESRFICCGYYMEGDWWSYSEHGCGVIGGAYEGDEVTHWKPLPKPPREA